MTYELYYPDKEWICSADTLKEARAKAMKKYKGSSVYIYKRGRNQMYYPLRSSLPLMKHPIGYVSKNYSGFFYNNLEKKIIQYLKKDGSTYPYR